MNVYIDIETIPSQSVGPDEFKDLVKVPGNYKKPEVIEQYKVDNAETEWRKTALDGTMGEIVCIGYAIGNDAPKTVSRSADESERALLESFWEQFGKEFNEASVTQPVWVGHNITGFDLRYIWQRCVVNDVVPYEDLRVNAKPWSEFVVDTLYEWKGTDVKGGSLDKVCKALGIEGKGDIDGSKVWDYVKEGRIEEVADYCADDVEKCRKIYKRMRFID
jgi:predicted PolB exonuclease-like 3'-5' exonuclease